MNNVTWRKKFCFKVHLTQIKIKSLLHFYIYKIVTCLEYIFKSLCRSKSCVNMYSEQNSLCFNVIIANKNQKSSYFFLIADCFLLVDIQLYVVYFYFQTAKKLFIGFFKDVVQGSKDILQCCHYKRPY